jgi:hypothetical protein
LNRKRVLFPVNSAGTVGTLTVYSSPAGGALSLNEFGGALLSISKKGKLMTTTVKVHVNGNYRAICKRNGKQVAIVGPEEEKQLPHTHGETNTYEITEEQIS